MTKVQSNQYLLIRCKTIFMMRLLAVCLAVLSVGLLLYMASALPEPAARAARQADQKEAVAAPRAAVIGWMKARSEMPEQVLVAIYDEAARSVNADLILAICAVESDFNPAVKSPKGALGLMGITSRVWLEELKGRGLVSERRDLFLIPNNIAAGTYVLEKYLARSGSLEQALTDYVGGDSNYAGRILQALGEIYLAKMPLRNEAGTAAAAHPEGDKLAYR